MKPKTQIEISVFADWKELPESTLNIDQPNDSLDIDVALNVSGYFRLSATKANAIRKKIMEVSRNWKKVALRYKISKSEIERMEPAFGTINPSYLTTAIAIPSYALAPTICNMVACTDELFFKD